MSGATHELGVCAAVRPEAQSARATGMCLSAGSVCDYRATKYQYRKHTRASGAWERREVTTAYVRRA